MTKIEKATKAQPSYKLNRNSMIVATVIVSESEIQSVLPDYSAKWETDFPEEFKKLLWDLGLDTALPYSRQDGLTHRNRLNQIVLCSRWIGEERQDETWVKSRYSSQEARDKFTGNKILEDLYRSKNLTKDAQEILEDRDRHTIIDESSWI